jgi:hypothetical protein
MKAVVTVIALTLATSLLHAQSVRVTSARVFNAGIYELNSDKKTGIEDKSISTGKRYEIPVRFVKATTTIPMRDNLVFGANFDIAGSPKGATKLMRTVWRYPSPGISGRLVDEIPGERTIDNNNELTWIVGKWASTLPLGVWTLELWDGDRLLAKQAFNLVRAQKTLRVVCCLQGEAVMEVGVGFLDTEHELLPCERVQPFSFPG